MKYISILIFIALLAGLSYFIFSDLRGSNGNTDNQNTATTSPSGEDFADLVIEDGIEIPDLDRPFTIPDIYSDEIKKNSMDQYNTIIDALREDPSLRNEWLQIAVFRNTVEDYEGAEEIWLFMTEVWPLDPVAFGNLGHLYMNVLTDYEEAEFYLQRAVEKNPLLTQNAQNLYDLYRFRLENPDRAIESLLVVQPVVPNELFYPIRIAEHYRDTGNPSEAKKYFEITRDLAKVQLNTDIENYAKEELAKL